MDTITATASLFRRPSPIVEVRGVHLDLKGCPPTAERLVSLLRVIAAFRHNAVFVEWEDAFPWTVDPQFRSETAYSPDEVRRFCQEAVRLGVELVPIVQCLGHMETVLSLPEYEAMREVPDRVDVLHPLAPGARQVVERMVDDVLALMPGVRRLHLGGDEAWTFGQHPASKAYIAEHGAGALYLHHVGPILEKLNARGVRPMLWHDMMVNWDAAALRSLAGQADLVVWGYRGHPDKATGHFKTANIQRLHDHGLRLWGAGAYKGADGHNADLPNWDNRLENALAWADIAGRFPLAGLIATAWSRYSTHMVQNEPIDAALDTLALLGAIFHDGAAPAGGREACEAALEALGEGSRFRACRDAMKKLADLRRRGWGEVAACRENRIAALRDSRRRASQPVNRSLGRLRDILIQLDAAAGETRRAFEGLMPAIWIDRYLAERIEPLRDEAVAMGE